MTSPQDGANPPQLPEDGANTNCLHGMQCPKCKSREPFAIEVLTTFRVFDDGTDDQVGATDWDEESYCECCECEFVGVVKDFTIPATEIAA